MTEIAPRPVSIARNAFTAAGLNITRGVLGFATSLVVARSLGPSGQGHFGFVTSTVTVLVMLGTMGVSSGLIHAKAKLGRSIDELYAASLVIGVLTAAVLSVGFGAAYLVLRNGPFRAIDGGEALWVAILIPPLLVLSHWNVVAYLDNRIGQFGRAAVVGAAFFLVACSASAIAGGLSVSTTVAFWSVSTLVPIVLIVRQGASLRVKGILAAARQIFYFGLRTNMATIALILVWRIDVFLVAAKRGVGELGLYTIAVGIGEIMLQIGVAFRVALVPLQGSGGDRARLREAILRVSRVVLLVGTAMTLVTIVVARPLVGMLYGDAFARSAPALAWLVPGVLALLLQGPLVDYLLTEGRVRAVTVTAVGALGLNVGLNLVMLTHHTFVVASATSTISYTVGLLAYLVIFARTTRCSLRDFVRFSRSDLRLLRGSAA